MRLVAAVAVFLLVAGCSDAPDSSNTADRSPLSVPTPSATSSAAPPTTSTSKTPEAIKPGAPIGDVISWIEAGEPATPEQFVTVTREGVNTDVEGGVAFTTEFATCISTEHYRDGALACLVDLKDPPPRPPDAFTVWKGNWVDFDGTTVDIGSLRGDPGPFRSGEGRALQEGQSLAFGDFRCRADAAAMLCVNYAQRSATRLSPDGVDPFGCLTESTAPPGIGVRLSC